MTGPEKLIVYVDGFNLYHGLHAEAGRRWLWLDLVALAEALRPRSDVLRVNYFTAPVLGDRGGAHRQAEYQNALVARHGERIRIVQGRYQRKQMTCRKCGASWTKHEEKETDVNIAVTLVADAAARTMESALVISADSDLAPGIRTARQVNGDLNVVAAFPPQRNSEELRKLMTSSFPIGLARLRQAQLPLEVTSPGGATYRRPQHWA